MEGYQPTRSAVDMFSAVTVCHEDKEEESMESKVLEKSDLLLYTYSSTARYLGIRSIGLVQAMAMGVWDLDSCSVFWSTYSSDGM